jgi:tRNA pseudouridine32 synthase/23S rRNA pseudouridine746 synthase
MDHRHIEHHLPIKDREKSSVKMLSKATGLSKNVVKQTMQKGAVWITRDSNTRRLRRAKKQLAINDVIHIYYDEKILSETTEPAQLVSDEHAYSVWNKPYGMRSQGSRWGDHTTIQRWAETHLQPQRPTFTVHRLDRAASGLILVAHEKQTATRLAKLFETHAMEKKYCAIVNGPYPCARQTYTQTIDNRSAHTEADLLCYDAEKNRSLLEVTILTGRKHQIRRHLADAGFPIVGDRLYGSDDHTQDLQLAAHSLAFQCPVAHEAKTFKLAEAYYPTL